MGLRLNRIEEEVARETLPYTQKTVDRDRVCLAETPNARRHYELADSTRDLALEYYQQERPVDEILDLLVESAEMTLRSWELRTQHQGGGITDYTTWYRLLSPVIAFGPASHRARLAAIPDAVIYDPAHRDDPDSDHWLIGAIRHWCATGKLGEAYQAALALASRDGADRHDRKLVLPAVQGLGAVVHRVADAWNASLLASTAEHKRQALRGELQRDVQGYINLEGIWLFRLGLERGLTCTIDSPYLPRALMEAACSRFGSPDADEQPASASRGVDDEEATP